MGLVDFTNPAAREWFKDKVKALLNQGVDAIKTDFGERIPRDVVWYDGSPKLSMHNWYTQLYNQAVFEAIEETYGKGNACLYARSATVGGQQQPVHWGGDCESTFNGMAQSMPRHAARWTVSICSVRPCWSPPCSPTPVRFPIDSAVGARRQRNDMNISAWCCNTSVLRHHVFVLIWGFVLVESAKCSANVHVAKSA